MEENKEKIKWPSQRKYTTGNKENKEKHGTHTGVLKED
jgi:hypothetical protein